MTFRWPGTPSTGEAQVWQQVGNIGAGIGQLGATFNEQQAQVDFEAFKIQFEGEMDSLGDRLRKNQDETTYHAEVDKIISGAQRYMPKNGLAKRSASSLINQRTPQLHDDANEAMKARVQSKWNSTLITRADAAVRDGHVADYALFVTEGVRNGNISEEDATKGLLETRHAVEFETMKRFATADPDGLLEETESDIKGTLLDVDDVERLRRIAKIRKCTFTN